MSRVCESTARGNSYRHGGNYSIFRTPREIILFYAEITCRVERNYRARKTDNFCRVCSCACKLPEAADVSRGAFASCLPYVCVSLTRGLFITARLTPCVRRSNICATFISPFLNACSHQGNRCYVPLLSQHPSDCGVAKSSW